MGRRRTDTIHGRLRPSTISSYSTKSTFSEWTNEWNKMKDNYSRVGEGKKRDFLTELNIKSLSPIFYENFNRT